MRLRTKVDPGRRPIILHVYPKKNDEVAVEPQQPPPGPPPPPAGTARPKGVSKTKITKASAATATAAKAVRTAGARANGATMDTTAAIPITENQKPEVAPPEQVVPAARPAAKAKAKAKAKGRARSRTPAKEEAATPAAPKPPPPPPPPIAETVSAERGRSASGKKVTRKTTRAAAENEEAKEAPPPKNIKDEAGQAKLVAPSSLKKGDTIEQVLRVSKMEGFDKQDAARIRELAAQMEGADAKT